MPDLWSLAGKKFAAVSCLREAGKANIPFMAALTGALRRFSSLAWLDALEGT